MGLGMYLSAKKYVSGYDFVKDEEKAAFNKLLAAFGLEEAPNKSTPSGYLEVVVAYWRKANAIHGWFVDTLADGNDDCKPVSVSREDLQKLVDLCKQTLAGVETGLEPRPGFFFGSTAKDDGYAYDLENTIKQLEAVLNNPKLSDCAFEYVASW